jgi:hypothetical protein
MALFFGPQPEEGEMESDEDATIRCEPAGETADAADDPQTDADDEGEEAGYGYGV